MKILIIVLGIFSPILLFSQTKVSFTVDGIKHTVNGDLIYAHKADKMDDCYLTITKDSIIYHSISWESGNSASTTASTYMEMGLLKKNAGKKVDSHKIKEIVEESNTHYMLVIKFNTNILHQIFYLKGMKPVHDNKKTEMDMLFDSKENAKKFFEDYFSE